MLRLNESVVNKTDDIQALRLRYAIARPTNSANGAMSCAWLAASSAAMYACRSSTRIVVHGYPPDASIMFIRNRAMRGRCQRGPLAASASL